MSYGAYLHCKPDGTPFYVGKGTPKRSKFLVSTKRNLRNPHHQNVVSKYGAENILVGFLECSTEQFAFDLERGLIKCLRRMGIPLTNKTEGGEGSSGYKHTESAKIKMRGRLTLKEQKDSLSALMRGRKHSPETIEKRRQSLLGHITSEETRAKIALANTGKKQKPEQIEKHRLAMLGTKASDETKAKLSLKKKGIPLSENHKANIAAGNRGKKVSEESKAKMAESHRGKKSEETIAKGRATRLANKMSSKTTYGILMVY